jgi:thioredoxin-dependent peroxiredoxin
MLRKILAIILLFFAGPAFAMMKPGMRAPDFTIEAAQGGKEFQFTLSEALKKGPVVLYFYPKSFTSVCTVEAHEFAEAMEQFSAMNTQVIGVSADKIETQKEFSLKECRNKFPVGADEKLKLIEAYDAAFEAPIVGRIFADRISYVISTDGKIVSAVKDSGAHRHIENALGVVKNLQKSPSPN